MFFTGNLQDCRNSVIVVLEDVSNVIGNVLVDQNNANVVPRGKVLKGLLDRLKLGIGLDNQKVGTVWSAVTDACQQEPRDSVLMGNVSDARARDDKM